MVKELEINLDCTENQELLVEKENRYNDLIENAYDLIQSVKPDGSFDFVNRAWLQTLGYSEAELPSLNLNDIIHSDSKKHCQEAFARIVKGERISDLQATFITKDGRSILIEGSAFPRFIGDKMVATHGIFRDITERKKAEAALRQNEERFRQLAENARDMIYRMSLPEGRYEYVNPASKNLWGCSPEEFYNTPLLIDKIIHPDGRAAFDQQWKELMTGDSPFSWEYQIIHKSGEIRWMHQRNSFFRNDRGEPIAVEGVVTDVTEKKKAEQVLKERKRELEIKTKNLEDSNVEYQKKLQEFTYDAAGRLIKNRRQEQRFRPMEGLFAAFHKPSFFKWGRAKSIKLGQIVDISKKGLALLYPGKEIQSTNFNKLSLSMPSLKLKTDKILYRAISDKAILADVYESARLCRIEFDGLTPAQQSQLNTIILKCTLPDQDAADDQEKTAGK